MPTETETAVPIMRARDILGELASRADYGPRRIPLSRRGTVIAYIVGLEDVEWLRASRPLRRAV